MAVVVFAKPVHMVIDLSPVGPFQQWVNPDIIIEVKPVSRALEHVLVTAVNLRRDGIVPLHVNKHHLILLFLV
jgi:hypothetical protein